MNVGGIGLRRFARILQRKNVESEGKVNIPVACVTDLDVMPDCAPEIIGKVKPGEAWPAKRRWRAKKDFPGNELTKRREEIRAKASGQNVETFVADEWTLEYDLAYSGLAKEVWLAAHLAKADENIHSGKITIAAAAATAHRFVSSVCAPRRRAGKGVRAPHLSAFCGRFGRIQSSRRSISSHHIAPLR